MSTTQILTAVLYRHADRRRPVAVLAQRISVGDRYGTQCGADPGSGIRRSDPGSAPAAAPGPATAVVSASGPAAGAAASAATSAGSPPSLGQGSSGSSGGGVNPAAIAVPLVVCFVGAGVLTAWLVARRRRRPRRVPSGSENGSVPTV